MFYFSTFYVTYQTKNTLFEHISQHREDREYENTTRSGECSTNFEVLGNEVKKYMSWAFQYIFSTNLLKTKEKTEN